MNIQLIPYKSSYDAAINELENSIVQGKGVKLRILKNHFLDRATAFKEYHACLAINKEDKVIGTAIGSKTKMIINGNMQEAGFGFDVKVDKMYRSRGIGRLMAKHQKDWFRREGLQKNFTTLKLSNLPVIKLNAKAIGKIWLYKFVYLTISTGVQVRQVAVGADKGNFSVTLFDEGGLCPSFYTTFTNGLGCFYTGRLYRLRIERISWLYQRGLWLLRQFRPHRFAQLPAERDVMEFATLFNHSEKNISGINQVLQHLHGQGKKYLTVCCQKKDFVYTMLKPYSISSYGYYMLSDFPLQQSDTVTIDVRCL